MVIGVGFVVAGCDSSEAFLSIEESFLYVSEFVSCAIIAACDVQAAKMNQVTASDSAAAQLQSARTLYRQLTSEYASDKAAEVVLTSSNRAKHQVVASCPTRRICSS